MHFDLRGDALRDVVRIDQNDLVAIIRFARKSVQFRKAHHLTPLPFKHAIGANEQPMNAPNVHRAAVWLISPSGPRPPRKRGRVYIFTLRLSPGRVYIDASPRSPG